MTQRVDPTQKFHQLVRSRFQNTQISASTLDRVSRQSHVHLSNIPWRNSRNMDMLDWNLVCWKISRSGDRTTQQWCLIWEQGQDKSSITVVFTRFSKSNSRLANRRIVLRAPCKIISFEISRALSGFIITNRSALTYLEKSLMIHAAIWMKLCFLRTETHEAQVWTNIASSNLIGPRSISGFDPKCRLSNLWVCVSCVSLWARLWIYSSQHTLLWTPHQVRSRALVVWVVPVDFGGTPHLEMFAVLCSGFQVCGWCRSWMFVIVFDAVGMDMLRTYRASRCRHPAQSIYLIFVWIRSFCLPTKENQISHETHAWVNVHVSLQERWCFVPWGAIRTET